MSTVCGMCSTETGLSAVHWSVSALGRSHSFGILALREDRWAVAISCQFCLGVGCPDSCAEFNIDCCCCSDLFVVDVVGGSS